MKSSMPPLNQPFAYCDTPELRVFDLSADGVPCIPVLGLARLGKGGRLSTGEEHIHDECIEISYCKRGELVFESGKREYPLRPGGVLATFSCSGAMTPEFFETICREAAWDAKRDFQIVAHTQQAVDHPVSLNLPEGSYLKGLILRGVVAPEQAI